MPTHRLLRGLSPISSDVLIGKLTPYFSTRVASDSLEDAQDIWSLIERDSEQGQIAFFAPADQKWVVANITEQGHRKMAEVSGDQSSAWRSLGVSILHRLVIDTLLGSASLPAPKYVHSINEVVDAIKSGDTSGRDLTGQEGVESSFGLAAIVMPATLEHIREIAGQGERMPAKSTYFYPKLQSGLVINPLE